VNLNQIRLVYFKEMKDIIRDKRTLRLMILVPVVIFPLMSFGISGLTVSMAKKQEARDAPVMVVGESRNIETLLSDPDNRLKIVSKSEFVQKVRDLDANEFATALEHVDAWERDPHGGLDDSTRTRFYYSAIKGKALDCILEIPPGFVASAASDSVTLPIYYDEQEFRSDAAESKVRRVLYEYRDSLTVTLLTDGGVSREQALKALKPFWIGPKDVAPAEKKSGFLLALMLPYMIVLMVMLGAMYPAIDLTAGEKERGTLETILASPAGRLEVTLGKFFCVFTAAIVTVLLGCISMTVSSSFGLAQMKDGAATGGFNFAINPEALAVVVLLMIPTAVLFSAVLLAIAVMARSYKEAQSYVSPMMFLVIIPSMISFMPGVELNAALAWVPVSNIALGVRTALLTARGEAFPWGNLSIVFVATGVYATFALFLVRQMFNKESVLFRT
jgi:sodium transport system permease protein